MTWKRGFRAEPSSCRSPSTSPRVHQIVNAPSGRFTSVITTRWASTLLFSRICIPSTEGNVIIRIVRRPKVLKITRIRITQRRCYYWRQPGATELARAGSSCPRRCRADEEGSAPPTTARQGDPPPANYQHSPGRAACEKPAGTISVVSGRIQSGAVDSRYSSQPARRLLINRHAAVAAPANRLLKSPALPLRPRPAGSRSGIAGTGCM